jgi:hypothetical protein
VYKVVATPELITQFCTAGNKVWEGKAHKGLPPGCKLERVEFEEPTAALEGELPIESASHSKLVACYFSHPDSSHDIVDTIYVQYETKWTSKSLNHFRKRHRK